jgi:hypothetical protein
MRGRLTADPVGCNQRTGVNHEFGFGVVDAVLPVIEVKMRSLSKISKASASDFVTLTNARACESGRQVPLKPREGRFAATDALIAVINGSFVSINGLLAVNNGYVMIRMGLRRHHACNLAMSANPFVHADELRP